jgi:hypothetical protein
MALVALKQLPPHVPAGISISRLHGPRRQLTMNEPCSSCLIVLLPTPFTSEQIASRLWLQTTR